jgi:hypothetical protein
MPTTQPALTVIGIGGGLEARDHVPQILHPSRELMDHPGPADDQHDPDPDELRDEGQGHLLDLANRLEDRHHEPDDQAHGQDGPGELEGHQHRPGEDVDHGRVVHGPTLPSRP